MHFASPGWWYGAWHLRDGGTKEWEICKTGGGTQQQQQETKSEIHQIEIRCREDAWWKKSLAFCLCEKPPYVNYGWGIWNGWTCTYKIRETSSRHRRVSQCRQRQQRSKSRSDSFCQPQTSETHNLAHTYVRPVASRGEMTMQSISGFFPFTLFFHIFTQDRQNCTHDGESKIEHFNRTSGDFAAVIIFFNRY